MTLRSFLVSIILIASFGAQLTIAAQKPLDYFFNKPRFTQFQLSPDGKDLGVLKLIDGRLNLVIINLEKRTSIVVSAEKGQDIHSFMWANSSRLLFFTEKGGNQTIGIFAVNKDASKFRVLAEPVDRQIKLRRRSIEVTSILDLLPGDEKHILVTISERPSVNPDVYKLNINNGRKKLFMRNPGKIVGWKTDWQGSIIGGEYSVGQYTGFMILNKNTGTFEERTRFRLDEPSFLPVFMKEDSIHGYARSTINPDGSTRDKAALYTFRLDTMKLGELVYEHKMVDCCTPIGSRKSRDLVGISYAVGKPEIVYLSNIWQVRMQDIDRRLPHTVNSISSIDHEESIAVISSESSRHPTRYYLFDMTLGSLEALPASMPWIEPAEMAEMKPIRIVARDGLELHGQLTLPLGTRGNKLPLIMKPHGGPWSRDIWGFDPEIQFLANRGYAVIQVNFRGSVGFGRKHFDIGKKQWGRGMQDDLSDAVRWAIEEGIADKNRICIYGGSYGGYAVMAGLAFTPELYQCGINYGGITNLPLLFQTMPATWGTKRIMMKERVGDPEKESAFLEQWSPTNHADKIQAPVLMAYGLLDNSVNIEHAYMMEKAMKEHGVDFELMIKKGEGHGFQKQQNQYEFYRRMESFLAENLNQKSQN